VYLAAERAGAGQPVTGTASQDTHPAVQPRDWLPGQEEDRSMTIAALVAAGPAQLADHALQARITSPDARCVGSASDPDDWFPLAAEPGKVRAQASHARSLCGVCAVRAECLELALRHWRDVGRHGIWGGTLESQRQVLRQEWLSGLSVTDC
jgi:WhiB family transcriptional regulator, redox-sensing transcriptional regulator